MPTKRSRLSITETEEVAAALDGAAARWPDVRSRRQLVLRLVERGREAVEGDLADAIARGATRSAAQAAP
jgi:hypothetical protein